MTLNIILFIIYLVLSFYGVFLLLDILFRWIPSLYEYKLPRIISEVASWYFGVFENRIVFGGLDLSRLVGIFIYQAIASLFIGGSFFGLF